MKKNNIIRLIVIIIFLVAVWRIIYPNMTIMVPEYTNEDNNGESKPFGEILGQNTLVQEIRINKNIVVDSIDIQLANYASVKTNKNQLMIYKNGELKYEEIIRSETVEDNKFRRINNLNLNCIKGDKLYLVLTSKDGISGQAITAWIKTDINNNKLYRYNITDGSYSEVKGELSMSINTKKVTLKYVSEKYLDNDPTIAVAIFVILMILLLILGYQFIFIKEEGEQEDEINSSNTVLQ